MWIRTQSGDELFNTRNCTGIVISNIFEVNMLICDKTEDDHELYLGRYDTAGDAREVIDLIWSAIKDGEAYFDMPGRDIM